MFLLRNWITISQCFFHLELVKMLEGGLDLVLVENILINKCSKKIHVVLHDFVFSIKTALGEGAPSYLEEFKLKKTL